MITELRVRDLATIADVTLQLGPGLNVLTGETGAGKSMLVDALALLLGERAASGSVRPGAAKTIVEGAFEGVDTAARARGSRRWASTSRTAARRPARGLGRGAVPRLGERQPHHRRGARRSSARCWWTSTASTRPSRCSTPTRSATSSTPSPTRRRSARRWPRRTRRSHALRAEEAALAARRDEVRRRADYLRHVVSEIDAAKLKPGEDEALQVEARRLSQAGALVEQAQRIADALEGDGGNALGAVGVADRALARWRRWTPRSPAGGRCWTPPTPTSPSWRGSPRRTRRRCRRIPSAWRRSSAGGTCCSG